MNVLTPRLRIPRLRSARPAPTSPRESERARLPLKPRAPRSARPLASDAEPLSRETTFDTTKRARCVHSNIYHSDAFCDCGYQFFRSGRVQPHVCRPHTVPVEPASLSPLGPLPRAPDAPVTDDVFESRQRTPCRRTAWNEKAKGGQKCDTATLATGRTTSWKEIAPWEGQTLSTDFHLGIIRQDDKESKTKVKSFSRSLLAISDLMDVDGPCEQAFGNSGANPCFYTRLQAQQMSNHCT